MKMKWRKNIVEWTDQDGERANLSVAFTWDALKAYSRSVRLRQAGYSVRVGGPGVFTMRKMFKGVAEVGGEVPDAVRLHNGAATFASKGCPVGCNFCLVPAMEGRKFTLLPDFEPRPVLCDNNLSALPSDYQDYIVERYAAAGVPLVDANSGFEPQTFDAEVFARWKKINLGPWRYAYYETAEGDDVELVCGMLADVPARDKRVYVLIGNEPFEGHYRPDDGSPHFLAVLSGALARGTAAAGQRSMDSGEWHPHPPSNPSDADAGGSEPSGRLDLIVGHPGGPADHLAILPSSGQPSLGPLAD